MIDNDTIEKYYRDNFERLVKKVSYRVGGIPNAEDVVQESFARALKYKRAYDPETQQFGGWFNTIINNATKDFKRDSRPATQSEEDTEITEPLDSSVFKRQMVDCLLRELRDKSTRAAQALKLYLFMEFTMKEVAHVTDYSPYTIRQMAYDFRQDMKEKYGDEMCW